MGAHQQPIMMKMEPSFTIVVLGTEGSSRSLIWPRILTLCMEMHLHHGPAPEMSV